MKECVFLKIGIIGSREIDDINDAVLLIEENLPDGCSEIVSGGAEGIDKAAKISAKRLSLQYTCFLPEYDKFGKSAPIVRNQKIVDYSDEILAFWDFKSKGTQNGILESIKTQKPVKIINII